MLPFQQTVSKDRKIANNNLALPIKGQCLRNERGTQRQNKGKYFPSAVSTGAQQNSTTWTTVNRTLAISILCGHYSGLDSPGWVRGFTALSSLQDEELHPHSVICKVLHLSLRFC